MPLRSPESSKIGNLGRSTLNLATSPAPYFALLTIIGLYDLLKNTKALEKESIVPVVTSPVEVSATPRESTIPSVEPHDIAPTLPPPRNIDSPTAPEQPVLDASKEKLADQFLEKVRSWVPAEGVPLEPLKFP